MDFDRLPNEIRLKILLQLPFEERVRLARVSKRFQQMSSMAVSKTRVFDLTADTFQDANGKTMSRLIKQCAGNLREVVHGYTNYQPTPYRVRMISKFVCPRLAKLDLGYGTVKRGVLGNLLVNSPNLRSFGWICPTDTFPPDVVCEKLERVVIEVYTPEFVESLARASPNLKHVVLECYSQGDSNEWGRVLNSIFADKPLLETLELKHSLVNVRVDQLENLWSLAELRSLSLPCREVSDETMVKISKDFSQLERLSLRSSSDSQQKVSSRGIGALSGLKHLRELELSQRPRGEFDIDRGAWRLAEYGRLRVVHFTDQLSPVTMRAFVQHCRMLRRLSVWHVDGVDTSDAAKEFVESLSGFVQENLKISLQSNFPGHRVWHNKEVKEAKDRVNATANGRKISIRHRVQDEPGGGNSMSVAQAPIHSWAEPDVEEDNMLQLIFGDDASIAENAFSIRDMIRKVIDFMRASFRKMFH